MKDLSLQRALKQAPLANWTALNTFLRTANEKQCLALLRVELKTTKRVQTLLRIYGTYNKLRAARERAELLSKVRF